MGLYNPHIYMMNKTALQSGTSHRNSYVTTSPPVFIFLSPVCRSLGQEGGNSFQQFAYHLWTSLNFRPNFPYPSVGKDDPREGVLEGRGPYMLSAVTSLIVGRLSHCTDVGL